MSQPEIESLSHQIDPESLAVLPRTSGVYIFKGEGTLPAHIGKSVDIRAIAQSLPSIRRNSEDVIARGDALYGAWLCGTVLGNVGMALRHQAVSYARG
jgi:hypothetical protein